MIEPPKLNAADVARTFRVLRRLDPDSVKVLRKDLTKDLQGMAKDIASKYPSSPVLSGFRNSSGAWAWGKVTGRPAFTPGRTRRGAGARNVLSLQMQYKNATPWVVELIGSSGGVNLGRYVRANSRYKAPYGQGPALYRNITARLGQWPNGGRVFYKEFNSRWREAYDSAEKIINDWSEQITKELS